MALDKLNTGNNIQKGSPHKALSLIENAALIKIFEISIFNAWCLLANESTNYHQNQIEIWMGDESVFIEHGHYSYLENMK